MKRTNLTQLLAATLLVLSASGIAFAQPATPGSNSGKWAGKSPAQCQAKRAKMHKKFAQELGLSADQQKKIDTLKADFKTAHKAEFDAQRAQYQELKTMKQNGADQAQIDAKRATLHQQFASLKTERKQLAEQIKAVLTPEQAQKFETMKAKHHHRHGHHGQGQNQPKGQSQGMNDQKQ